MNDPHQYQSPLATRNASPCMSAIWSPHRKFSTWRRLWLALAEAQMELGLEIEPHQVAELGEHLEDIDYAEAAVYERRFRHDVMAHIHLFGDAARSARPIIHLGATSQFVNCNTELLLLRDALQLVARKLAGAILHLGAFAARTRHFPTLGLTHLQPAQPTTVGKRAAMWAYDMSLALEEVEHRLSTLRFRGIKGTTGTQASFLALFEGDHAKVEQLDRLVTEKMGWNPEKRFVVTGQTYPRLIDAMVAATLAAVAAACQKFASDMRLLSSRAELDEPFETEQVGSSTMAYKRNPIRCERICGLARFVIGLTTVPFTTAGEQWMERTIDDSSTRRLSLPEPFLAIDGILEVVNNVASGIVVYERSIASNLEAQLPFMASENLMMAAVKQGGDRQQVHEVIREHSQAAAQRVKTEGAANDLLARLRREPVFEKVDLNAVLEPSQFIGRAPEQVDSFLTSVVEPIRARYPRATECASDLKV